MTMYKVTITHYSGKREIIDPFPTDQIDFYGLIRLIDKCEIKSYSVCLSKKY